MRPLLALVCLLVAVQAANARHRRATTEMFFPAPSVRELEKIVAPDGTFVDPRFGFISSIRPGRRLFEPHTPGIVADFGQMCKARREAFVHPDGSVFAKRRSVMCQ